MQAISDFREAFAEDAALQVLDYRTASEAEQSGRPLEFYIDAPDIIGWRLLFGTTACPLRQAAAAGPSPRPSRVGRPSSASSSPCERRQHPGMTEPWAGH